MNSNLLKEKLICTVTTVHELNYLHRSYGVNNEKLICTVIYGVPTQLFAP